MTNFLKATAVTSHHNLTAGISYKIVAMDFEPEKTFFYVILTDAPLTIERYDETFFQEQDFLMPSGWSFKVNPKNSTERAIMISELAKFDDWYHLYQKSDQQVMSVLNRVNSEIL